MSQIDITKPLTTDPLYNGPSTIRTDINSINTVVNQEHQDTGAHLYTAPRLLQQAGTGGLTQNLNNLVYDTSLKRIWFWGYDSNNAGPKWIMLPHGTMFSGSFTTPAIATINGGVIFPYLAFSNYIASPMPLLYKSLPRGLQQYPTLQVTITFNTTWIGGGALADFIVWNANGTSYNTPSLATMDDITFCFTPDNINFYPFTMTRMNISNNAVFNGCVSFSIPWLNYNYSQWKLTYSVNPSYIFASMQPLFVPVVVFVFSCTVKVRII